MLRIMIIGTALQALVPYAAALSLTNFRPFPEGLQVPFSCTLAYSQTIPNCVAPEFLNGAACSSGCINGLNLVSLSVKSSCPGVIVDSNTLLGKIFQGQLVSILCPNTDTTNSETSTSRAQQATTAEIPPATASAKVTSIPSIQTTSTEGAVSASASVVESNSFSTATRSAKSSAGGGLGYSTSTASTVEQTSTTASTQSASPKKTEAPKEGGSSAAAQQAAALQGTGGGSLFDIQLGGSTRSSPGSASLLVTPICMLCLGIILGR